VPTSTIPHFYRPDAVPAAEPTVAKREKNFCTCNALVKWYCSKPVQNVSATRIMSRKE